MKLRSCACAAALLAGLGLSGAASAGCYTIYNGKGQLVQRTGSTPVDMRYQLHQTVPRKFGKGAHMVFSAKGETCSDYSWAAARQPTGKRARSIENTSAILDNLVAAQNPRATL